MQRSIGLFVFCGVLGVAWLLAPLTASAQFNNVVIFGDSLSDTGNVFFASGDTFPPTSTPSPLSTPLYVPGRFTGINSGIPELDQNWIDRLANTFSTSHCLAHKGEPISPGAVPKQVRVYRHSASPTLTLRSGNISQRPLQYPQAQHYSSYGAAETIF